MRRIFVAIGLVLSVVFVHDGCADVNAELQGVNKEIIEKRALLSKTRKVENKVSSELGLIEKNLRDKEVNLASLGSDVKSLENQLSLTRKEIDTVRAEAERKKQQIRVRLSALYKNGEFGSARMFFSSESFPQMVENLRYMQSVLADDRKLFAEYNKKIERLRELKDALERDALRKEKILAKMEVKKQEIVDEKRKKAAYLVKVRTDKKSYQASLRELQVNARRLQAMVEKLEATHRKSYTGKDKKYLGELPSLPPVPDSGFGSQKGRLSLPARGEIVDGFGRHKHPEFNSYTVSNGISIAAPSGADIRAIYDGQIIFANYFKGYGNMVIVDHGGGYFTLYAHAARISKKVGSTVKRNEVVASVGDTDSSRGPMLYFEIRYQGKPVDPAVWVR